MDGYAVRAADLAAGSAEPAPGRQRAGGRPLRRARSDRARPCASSPADCCRPGADAVVLQENAHARRATACGSRARSSPAPSCVRPGSISGAASVTLPAGRRLTARDIGLAAALNQPGCRCGGARASRCSPPATSWCCPGSRWPARRSSAPTPRARRHGRGMGRRCRSISASRATSRHSLPRRASSCAGVDLVVTLGGASVGDRDLVRERARRTWPRLDFWQIAMRPGKPLMFGRLQACRCSACPATRSRPASAPCCSCAPRSARCSGSIPRPRRCRRCSASRSTSTTGARSTCARAPSGAHDGRLVAMPAARQDSSMLAVLRARRLPDQARAVRAGDAAWNRGVGAPASACPDRHLTSLTARGKPLLFNRA